MVRLVALACVVAAGCLGGDDGSTCGVPCPQRITTATLYLGDVSELDPPATKVTVWIDRLAASAPVPASAQLSDASTPLDGQFSGSLETRANDLGFRSYSVIVEVPFGPTSVYGAALEAADGTMLLRGVWDASSEPEVVCGKDCTIDRITKRIY